MDTFIQMCLTSHIDQRALDLCLSEPPSAEKGVNHCNQPEAQYSRPGNFLLKALGSLSGHKRLKVQGAFCQPESHFGWHYRMQRYGRNR
jgi:hypothetical protein